MNRLFRFLTDQIRNTEHALMTFIAAVIPWLVPIIPAYLTGYHVVNELKLPEWTGWVIGAIVEGLGLASMSRTIAFWENNRKYTKDTNKMPILVPLGTYIWYLVIVIVVNVLLERASGASPVRVWVVGLLATLSVPTAALISVTSIWTERVLEKERQKEERLKEKENVSERDEEVSESTQKDTETFPKDWRKLRPLLSDEQLSIIASVPSARFREFADYYGVTEKTISNWKSYAQAELGEQNDFVQ